MCRTERLSFKCGPEGSRTPNLLIRSQVLYPIKLQVRTILSEGFLVNNSASETECKNRNPFEYLLKKLKII